MKKYPYFLVVLAVGFIMFGLALAGTILSSGHALAATAEDDFNDNSKDTIKWGPPYSFGNGILKEKNSRLEYTVPVVIGPSTFTLWEFLTNQGAYTTTWETQIDLFNDVTTKPARKKYASMGMEVYKCSNWDNYLYVEAYSYQGEKGFYAELLEDNAYVAEADTVVLSNGGALNGSIQIAFDSTAKTFAISYDTGSGPVPFGSFGVAGAGGTDGNANWLMSDADLFCVDVYGFSRGTTIGSGKLYADNFQATGVTDPVVTRIVDPNGGEIIQAGAVHPVTWEAPVLATKFKLKYSKNNGTTWKAVAPGFVTGNSYQWNAPMPAKTKDKCLMKVIAFNQFNVKLGTDTSDLSFTIEVP